ncbi:MAG: YitT family protein [Eubacteriales bacterium]
MKTSWGKIIKEYTIIALASLVYAIGFNWCFVPNHLPYGGITGLILIADFVWGGIPVGSILILCNIPIFFLGGKLLGKTMLFRSIFAMVVSSALIDVVAATFTFAPMDSILACIYGGVTMGFSMGVILTQNASTGGTDLLSRVIRLKLGWIPVGRMMLYMDIFVIGLSALILKNMDAALYGLVAMYITAIAMDYVTFGVDKAQVAYIISENHQAVAEALTKKLNRGVTLIPSVGVWSGEQRYMLMCAFRHRQIVTVKTLVNETDPNAFFISCPAHEVLGRGFRLNHKS